ncbi:MAG: hypothetical protein HC908_16430 [Calothrix sp. SM1_7_51]|nr:hypothetical protein [Calothrix sp. SM1_7_51]
MKGDFTRFTFRPEKHYNSIWMQQGRLQLDADWNEFVEIQKYLHQTQAEDIIGASGAIRDSDSFKVSKVSVDDSDLKNRIRSHVRKWLTM